jgi:hypothetical protein
LADLDGDGRNNLQEFLDATDPLLADGRHPADNSPGNNFVSFEEADAYANAWLTGDVWPANPTNIPVAFVARAASLALKGAPYLFTNAPPTTWVSSQSDNNGASFTFSLLGVPASRYAIEFTTNLITWSILQTNLTDAGGNDLLWVTNSPPAAYQFYRARFVN